MGGSNWGREKGKKGEEKQGRVTKVKLMTYTADDVESVVGVTAKEEEGRH